MKGQGAQRLNETDLSSQSTEILLAAMEGDNNKIRAQFAILQIGFFLIFFLKLHWSKSYFIPVSCRPVVFCLLNAPPTTKASPQDCMHPHQFSTWSKLALTQVDAHQPEWCWNFAALLTSCCQLLKGISYILIPK